MVQLLAWQWGLIALAIVIFISLTGLGIYLFRRKQNKHSSTITSRSFDRPRGSIERNIQVDREERRKKDRDSVMGRVSSRFPSSLIIQQRQLYNQQNSDSATTTLDINTAIDLEKAQNHLVMMPLSAPPPRTGRAKKPKLICAKQQLQSKNADDNTVITTGGSKSNTSNNDIVHQESSSSSSSSAATTTSPHANTKTTMLKRECGDETNPNNATAIDDEHNPQKNPDEDENSTVVPMAMTTAINSETPSPTLAMAKGPFVLTPFIESPKTTLTSTSGRSTSELIIINSIHEPSLRSNNSNTCGTAIELPHQQQQPRYSSSTTSSSNYVLASSTIIDRPPSSYNNSNRSSSGSGVGGTPSDHQPQHSPYTINPLSSNNNTGWRGPTPPWTLLRDGSTINNNNKSNSNN